MWWAEPAAELHGARMGHMDTPYQYHFLVPLFGAHICVPIWKHKQAVFELSDNRNPTVIFFLPVPTHFFKTEVGGGGCFQLSQCAFSLISKEASGN